MGRFFLPQITPNTQATFGLLPRNVGFCHSLCERGGCWNLLPALTLEERVHSSREAREMPLETWGPSGAGRGLPGLEGSRDGQAAGACCCHGGALRAWQFRVLSPSFFTECERCLGPPRKFKPLADMELDNTEKFSYLILATDWALQMHLGENKNCKVLFPLNTARHPLQCPRTLTSGSEASENSGV